MQVRTDLLEETDDPFLSLFQILLSLTKNTIPLPFPTYRANVEDDDPNESKSKAYTSRRKSRRIEPERDGQPNREQATFLAAIENLSHDAELLASLSSPSVQTLPKVSDSTDPLKDRSDVRLPDAVTDETIPTAQQTEKTLESTLQVLPVEMPEDIFPRDLMTTVSTNPTSSAAEPSSSSSEDNEAKENSNRTEGQALLQEQPATDDARANEGSPDPPLPSQRNDLPQLPQAPKAADGQEEGPLGVSKVVQQTEETHADEDHHIERDLAELSVPTTMEEQDVCKEETTTTTSPTRSGNITVLFLGDTEPSEDLPIVRTTTKQEERSHPGMGSCDEEEEEELLAPFLPASEWQSEQQAEPPAPTEEASSCKEVEDERKRRASMKERLQGTTVAELRKALRKSKLPADGRKDDLIARLLKHRFPSIEDDHSSSTATTTNTGEEAMIGGTTNIRRNAAKRKRSKTAGGTEKREKGTPSKQRKTPSLDEHDISFEVAPMDVAPPANEAPDAFEEIQRTRWHDLIATLLRNRRADPSVSSLGTNDARLTGTDVNLLLSSIALLQPSCPGFPLMGSTLVESETRSF